MEQRQSESRMKAQDIKEGKPIIDQTLKAKTKIKIRAGRKLGIKIHKEIVC